MNMDALQQAPAVNVQVVNQIQIVMLLHYLVVMDVRQRTLAVNVQNVKVVHLILVL